MKIIILILWLFIFNNINSQIDYSKFKGQNGKIKFLKEYSLSNIYDYGIDAIEKNDSLIKNILNDDYPEALISKKYSPEFLNNTVDSLRFYVKLRTRLIINMDNKVHYLISYSTSIDKNPSVVDYVSNEANWTENTTSSNELKLLISILKNSTANIIFEFYNNKNNQHYPEINKLKALTKNAKGVLNIQKLAQVLRENKAILSKY